LIGRLKKQTVKAKAAKQLTTYGTGLFFEDERTALLAVSSTGVSTTSVLMAWLLTALYNTMMSDAG
jgi:hypothetical protein